MVRPMCDTSQTAYSTLALNDPLNRTFQSRMMQSAEERHYVRDRHLLPTVERDVD
jgi:hypothetical protein